MFQSRFLLPLAFLFLFAPAAATAGHGTVVESTLPVVSADQVKESIAGTHKAVIIDVGSVQEYRGAHIPGAINIPSVALKIHVKRLPKDKSTPLIFYGRDVGRSHIYSAANETIKLGYTYVSVFKGGLAAWMAKKYPIKKGPRP